MQTLQKYIIPDNRINGFVRSLLKYDIQIVLSYSFEETFNGLFVVVFVRIEATEIPHDLKVEKMKEYYSRYQKTIPNE